MASGHSLPQINLGVHGGTQRGSHKSCNTRVKVDPFSIHTLLHSVLPLLVSVLERSFWKTIQEILPFMSEPLQVSYTRAFDDGPRNFELWSSDVDDTCAGTPSPNYHTTPTGDVSALDRFSVHRCLTRRVFSGTGLELVTKPATIRYLYHSATAASECSSTCSLNDAVLSTCVSGYGETGHIDRGVWDDVIKTVVVNSTFLQAIHLVSFLCATPCIYRYIRLFINITLLKVHESYWLAIVSLNQVTKTVPELAPSNQTSAPCQQEAFESDRFKFHQPLYTMGSQ
ncbi:hypothetical protein TNCV_2881991 [Trichonephila clavipes]|nr:hypothetical protein TNCV_2881991 [Trichonephila clavipes]